MKKQLWIMIFLSLILTACSNLNGPERHVTIENKTDVEQKVTLIINDKKEETYTVPAHDTKTTTIVGGFKVKDNLGYKYRISFTAENSVCIIDSPKVKKTVINNLQVAVKLLDENDSDFGSEISEKSTQKIEVYNITHKFYLENQKNDGGVPYIEDNSDKVYFELKYINETLFISEVK